jgi:hypothetical protein
MTEIPDLDITSDHKSKIVVTSQSKKSTFKQKPGEREYIDLNTVNTKDNNFVWVALIAIGLTISYLVWLSF